MISANLVETLIHNLNGHTLLKDVKSAKYLDANTRHLSIYGLAKADQIRRQTIWELDSIMSSKWGENAKVTQFANKLVAASLKIKLSTVETHINHLNQKTENLHFIIDLLRNRTCN